MHEVTGESDREATLYACDRQFAAARPQPEILGHARSAGRRLPEVLAAYMEGYADRPALGTRSTLLMADEESGRTQHCLQPAFETLTYGQLWSDVKAIAAAWAGDPIPVCPGDFVATIGFASADYVTIDLVCAYLGLVAVPLQHNSSPNQLRQILGEALPTVVAVSARYLERAVEAAQNNRKLRRLLVFDYDSAVDDQREAMKRARSHLAGRGISLESLSEVVARGRSLPEPQMYLGDSASRLAAIFYTSGSTGTPKGAMYTEAMMSSLWTTPFAGGASVPVFNVNFMPLNHLAGRLSLVAAFQAGGTSYFTAENDLSTLFEDWQLVRPTHVMLVPRVVDMLYQRHHLASQRFRRDGMAEAEADVAAKSELRENVLGGRVLRAGVSTAPLAASMRAFVASCLGRPLVDSYGTTELGGVMQNGVIVRPPVVDYKLVDVPELGYHTSDKPHPRGELLVRSETTFSGYFQRPDVTAEVFDAQGYYRTGDVMAELAPDHLTYVDRRNNVVKLSQGEFVAVARLEAIYARTPMIHQIFVYGDSERPALVAVVVPTADVLDWVGDVDSLKPELLAALRTTAHAAELQPYELLADIVVETTPFSPDNGLLSGVGKVLRRPLIDRYRRHIDELHAKRDRDQEEDLRALREIADVQPVVDTIGRAARAVLGLSAVPVPQDQFVDLGGDSLSAVTFSHLLGELFGVDVSVGVIVDPSADLAAIAHYVETQSRGGVGGHRRLSAADVHRMDAGTLSASDLALDKFVDAAILDAAPSLAAPATDPTTVLITGGNGYLGRFLTLEWLQRLSRTGGRLVALVRGTDVTAARRRLEQSFSTDATMNDLFRRLSAEHLEVVVGDIGAPNLGVDDATWRQLARDVDLIVHPAALVNHVLPYEQLFGPNVVGTAEVIRLALSGRLKPIVYVSTVAVAMGVDDFPEDGDIREICPSRPISDVYANGYANSKWAGEVLLRQAHDVCGLPVKVFRCDMILAHRAYSGQLNVSDAFTRLLISLIVTGVAPRSFYAADGADGPVRAHYDGLPADFVASAIASIASSNLVGMNSFNVVNPHDDGISLDSFVDWLVDDGVTVTRIADYDEWLSRFTHALRNLPESQRRHSVLTLLDAYQTPHMPVRGAVAPSAHFREAVQANGVGDAGSIPRLDVQLIRKYREDLKAMNLT